jgi:hypothetical protein
MVVAQAKEGLYHDRHLTNVFLPLPQRFLIAFTNMQTILFIDVLIWCAQQKEMVIFWGNSMDLL